MGKLDANFPQLSNPNKGYLGACMPVLSYKVLNLY